MKYSRNKRYFFPRKIVTGLLVIVSGIFTMYVGLDKGILFSLILGGLLFAAGVTLLVLAIITRHIKETSLDAQLDTFTENAQQRALDDFSLTEAELVRPSIILKGYYYNTKDAKPLVKVGKDDIPRSNICVALVLLFTEDKLYWYDFKFSLVFKDDVVSTKTSVPYADIKNAALEDTNLDGETTRWSPITIKCKNFKVECADRTLNEYFIKNHPEISGALEDVKSFIRSKKKALSDR